MLHGLVFEQIVDEGSAQHRLGVAKTVPGELPPERDGVVDGQPDVAGGVVQPLGVGGRREMPQKVDEKPDVAVVPGGAEGARCRNSSVGSPSSAWNRGSFVIGVLLSSELAYEYADHVFASRADPSCSVTVTSRSVRIATHPT
ncbi:hypothetical protein [Fodinicola feengrottensis]|uniref:hypothetical protein n=1 Tax=Fodinicola feengrottensis TaxID=435914 RepID=UPI002442871F|nr:hypothetical protein [Fodinicola feengrottensis]